MPPKPPASTDGARIVKVDATQALNRSAAKPKKSNKGANGNTKKRKAGKADEDSDDSGSDVDFVNVDLDFFGFIESDYQALKNLLTQLFAHDAKNLDIAGLAGDLVEGEDDTTGDVGTGVKSDGEASDPLAFIGVLPWSAPRAGKEREHMKSLREYMVKKTSTSSPKLNAALQDSKNRIGVVFSERLVNMPVQVIPPLFRIFEGDLKTAGKPYSFTHLLFLSRTFLASPADFKDGGEGTSDVDMDDADAPAKKKSKKANKAVASLAASAGTAPSASGENFLYHPEDELIAALAGKDFVCEYKFSNAPKRGEMGEGMDFGVDMRGRATLLEVGKLEKLVEDIEVEFSA